MAVFEGLSDKLSNIVKKMRGQGRVTEKDVKQMSREIKLALLEADVNYKVVKSFVKTISEKALGDEVLESLTPGQQIVKVVNEELISLLGGDHEDLVISPKLPSVYMLCGLQGSGKTTTCGKLGNLLKKKNKKVLFVACDIYRPAAIDQLISLGKQLNIEVYSERETKDVSKIAKNALKHAKTNLYDTVIFDTAGRLHIDEVLMDELENLKKTITPDEILLVVDSMTGQDAVNVASSFNEKLGVSGIVLTKLDGDTRGGAALSVKKVTGKPIKFAGVGEKMNELEPFYPDRMASRILGMGDVLSLIEKAQDSIDQKKALEMEQKLRTAQFTLEDFLDQLEQLQNMGPLENILGMLPGGANLKGVNIDEKQMNRTKAIIQSMTAKERYNPRLLDASRRKRIAKGSGTSVQAVNKLLKDFNSMKKMMKSMTGKKGKALSKMKLPF